MVLSLLDSTSVEILSCMYVYRSPDSYGLSPQDECAVSKTSASKEDRTTMRSISKREERLSFTVRERGASIAVEG